MTSNDEAANQSLPPLVELRPGGPPVEIVEGYPNPLPPEYQPPPFDRGAALTRLQDAFALLTDDELQVAGMRMLGAPYLDISEELAIRAERAEKLWKQARRKLGGALFGPAEAHDAPAPPGTRDTPPREGDRG